MKPLSDHGYKTFVKVLMTDLIGKTFENIVNASLIVLHALTMTQ